VKAVVIVLRGISVSGGVL